MADSNDWPEWLQPPRRILVRRRSRLGPWYHVLRPLAIVFAALFWVLRGVLVVLIFVGLWAFWLVAQLFVALLDGFGWLLYKYARLRQGPAAEEELRRATAESERRSRDAGPWGLAIA